jgi:hypothetical protein
MLPFASRDNPSASLGSADGGGPIFWGLPQRARTKRDLVLVERPIVIIVGLRATSVPCGVNDPLKATDGFAEVHNRPVVEPDQAARVLTGYVENPAIGTGRPYSGRMVVATSSTVLEIVASENHGRLRLWISVLRGCGQSPDRRAKCWMYASNALMFCKSNIKQTRSTRLSIGGSVSRSRRIV